MMRGVGNQTRREIIDFLSKLRGRFPSVEAVSPQGSASQRGSQRATRSRTPGTSHRRGTQSQERRRMAHPSGLARRHGQRQPAAQPLAQPGRHCGFPGDHPSPRGPGRDGRPTPLEQGPRRHGVPPRALRADPSPRGRGHDPRGPRPDDPPAPCHRHAGTGPPAPSGLGGGQGGGRDGNLDGGPRGSRSGGSRGRSSSSCSPELAAYAEELGRKADELAASETLPPPLRVFQELYEISPAATAPRLSALRQRAALEARRRHEPFRRRVAPPGALPRGHAGGTGLAPGRRGAGRAGAWQWRGRLHHRSDPGTAEEPISRGRAVAGPAGA